MNGFFDMHEKDIVLLAAAIAILLAENLTVDQQNTLGNFLSSVGQNIILGAGQKALCEKDRHDDVLQSGCG
jgi:hypothetical protein